MAASATTELVAHSEQDFQSTLHRLSALGPSVFAFGAWLVMMASALAFVSLYGANVPFWDDWEMVPVISGAEPLSIPWLWSPQNEHRFPLSKLILWFLSKMTGGDLRAGMLASVLVLGATALGMMITARKLRGRTTYTDAFFPLVFLSLGHYNNMLWSIQFYYVSAMALYCLTVLMITWQRRPAHRGLRLALAVCLLLLTMHGGMGIALALPIAVWVAYTGLPRRRPSTPGWRKPDVFMLALAASTCVLILVQVLNYRASLPHVPSLPTILKTSLAFLAMSVGSAGSLFWPISGILLLALCLGTAVRLAIVSWRHPRERLRSSGLLLGLGAALWLGLTVGLSRGVHGEAAGMVPRYTTLAAPILCWVYLAWEVTGPRAVGRFLQMCLFTVMAALVPYNAFVGMAMARTHLDSLRSFKADLNAGVPPRLLAAEHRLSIYPHEQELARRLVDLRRSGKGPYAKVPSDVRNAVTHTPTTLDPVHLHQMTCEGKTCWCMGNDPYFVVAVGSPVFVHDLHLSYRFDHGQGPVSPHFISPIRRDPGNLSLLPSWSSRKEHLQVFWMQSGVNQFSEDARNVKITSPPSAGERTLTVFVNDVIDRVRIDPGARACEFTLTSMVLVRKSPANESSVERNDAEKEEAVLSDGEASSYSVSKAKGREVLIAPTGAVIPISANAIQGHVESVTLHDSGVVVNGWAADVKDGELPEAVVVVMNGEAVHVGRTGARRLDLIRAFDSRLEYAGFRYEIDKLRLQKEGEVRVFAIDKAGVASELRYSTAVERVFPP